MKRKAAAPDVVVRLFGEEWQRWDVTGGAARLLGADATLANGGGRRILAAPARQILASPLWIEGADPVLVAEAAKLELEVRGLLPRAQGMAGVSLRLLPQNERSLAVAAIFPPELPESCPAKDAERFEASPLLLQLPEDAVTLWREDADIVGAFTRGRDVVYWETIDRSVGAEELRAWLGLICLRLQGEGVIAKPPRVVSWVEGLPAARIAPAACAVEEHGGEIPVSPSLERARFDWKPASAHMAGEQRRRREQMRTIGLGIAAFYVVVVAILVIYAGIVRWKSGHLAAEAARLRAEVEKFQPIARDWDVLAPSVEPEQFPLEILRGVVMAMPPDGIRLTRFTIEDGKVTAEGEANTFQMATDFTNSLGSSESLRGIPWESGTPEMQPNNTTRFSVTGTLPSIQPPP
jgi:hypothetical protein